MIPATGHTNKTIPAVAPTCTTNGSTIGIGCTVCSEILTAPTVIPATGHTNKTIPAVAPTCTTNGSTIGIACTVCPEILTASTVIPATGHTEVTIPGKAPTATETGHTIGSYCGVCQAILVAPQTIPALGNNDSSGNTNPPADDDLPALPADVWDGSLDTAFDGGDGSASAPYLIRSGAQLAYLASLINSEAQHEAYADKYYRLTGNIDLNGLEWTSIGSEELPFCGSLDGNHYTISNYVITTASRSAGLFGSLSDAAIHDLRVADFHIRVALSDFVYAGGLAGFASSSHIRACSASGLIFSETTTDHSYVSVGGLIGYQNGGLVDGCRASGQISAASDRNFVLLWAGGLVGYLTGGTVSDSSSTATPTVSANGKYPLTYVGALCGENSGGTVQN